MLVELIKEHVQRWRTRYRQRHTRNAISERRIASLNCAMALCQIGLAQNEKLDADKVVAAAAKFEAFLETGAARSGPATVTSITGAPSFELGMAGGVVDISQYPHNRPTS